MIGVYKIQSIVKPERIYIGSAINIKNRQTKHLGSLKRNKHENNRLQNHYNKYGEHDLIFSTLTNCDANSLLKMEQYFIDLYNPFFNIRKIAGSQLGCHWKISPEGRKNMSKSRLGNTNAKGHSSHLKGRKYTKEEKIKISIATKKAMDNLELRKKLRELKLGVKGIGMTGKHHSKDTMQKIVEKTGKRMVQYNKNGNFIKEWVSIGRAAKELSLYSGNIVACAKNRNKLCGGFMWKYKEKITAENET